MTYSTRLAGVARRGLSTLASLLAVSSGLAHAVTVNYTTPGAYNFIVPAGINSITVTTTGAGGGGSRYSVGGAGGTVSLGFPWSVTPGETITIVVGGGGGAGGIAPSAPSFSTDYGAGGGGASSVNIPSSGAWIIAGGGGGAAGQFNRADGGVGCGNPGLADAANTRTGSAGGGGGGGSGGGAGTNYLSTGALATSGASGNGGAGGRGGASPIGSAGAGGFGSGGGSGGNGGGGDGGPSGGFQNAGAGGGGGGYGGGGGGGAGVGNGGGGGGGSTGGTCVAASNGGTIVTSPSTGAALRGSPGGHGSVSMTYTAYTLGGTVSNANAAGLVLTSGATPTQTVAVPVNATSFTFPDAFLGAYNVAVQTNPPGLSCAVTANPSGSITTANVSNVEVTCTRTHWTVTASPNPAVAGGVLNCGAPGGLRTLIPLTGGATTCTATPEAGYSTQSISGCGGMATGVGENAYTTGTVSAADCTVTAVFAPTAIGVCGSDNFQIRRAIPTTNRCASGTPSAVADYLGFYYEWQCTGSLTGATTDDADCVASIEYFVTATVSPSSPAGGSVSCTNATQPSTTQFAKNHYAECVATPASGYQFLQWTDANCVGANPTCNVLVSGDLSIHAEFGSLFTVTGTANPVAAGSVSCTAPDASGNSSCTANANTGYGFISWSGDCTGASACAFTGLTSNKTVVANFALLTYTVTGTASPAGTGTVACTPSPVSHGSDTACYPTAGAGYTFTAWSGDCTGSGACSLTGVTSNKSVTATFAAGVNGACGTAHTVATLAAPSGATALCTSGTASAVSTVADAYTWACNGSVAAITTDDAQCSAPRQFTVSASANPSAGGTASCAPATVNHNGDASCTPAPASGYSFTGWTGDCTGVGACALTGITSNKSVVAGFAPTATGVCGSANGVASATAPVSPNLCAAGTDSTVTAIAGGYSWSCSGSVAASVVDDAQCSSLTQYTISSTAAPANGGSILCTTPVTSGGNASCTATPASGYSFVRWTGDCTGTALCTLANVTADKSVGAEFAPMGNASLGGMPFSGTTVPAAGATAATATASFTTTGNTNPTCGFDATQTQFVAAPAPYPAQGSTQPHGHFRFKLVGCTPGFSATVSVVWPSLAGMTYTKYGKASATATASTFFAPQNLTINGNTATFTVADGALGDDDWAANGEIVDPSGPVRLAAEVSAQSIPTLGHAALMLLMGLLALFAARHGRMRR